jgi:hypothetical protein
MTIQLRGGTVGEENQPVKKKVFAPNTAAVVGFFDGGDEVNDQPHPYRSPYPMDESPEPHPIVRAFKTAAAIVVLASMPWMFGFGVGRSCGMEARVRTVTRTVVKMEHDETACVRMCHKRVVEFRREPTGNGYAGYTCKCR